MPVLDQTTRVVYRTIKRTGCFPNTRWAVGEVWCFPCFREPLCHASHPFSSPHSPGCYHPTLWQLCCFLLEGRLLPNVTPWVLFSLGEFWEPLACVLQTRLCILQRRGCFPWMRSIFCFSASHGNAAWCKHSVTYWPERKGNHGTSGSSIWGKPTSMSQSYQSIVAEHTLNKSTD